MRHTLLAIVLALFAQSANAQLVIPNDHLALVKIEAEAGGFLDSRFTGWQRPVMAEDASVIGCEVNAMAPLWIVGTVMTRDNATGTAEISVTATMGRGKKSLGPLVFPVEVVEPGGSGGETEFVGNGLRVTLLEFVEKP